MYKPQITLGVIFASLALLVSCGNIGGKTDEELASALVINEIVSSNQTGLMAENDSLYDWIEVKNISAEPLRLDNYVLAVEKDKRKKKDTIEISQWNFPEKELQPGEIALIFASKRSSEAGDKELHADLKIPGKRGKVQLQTKRGHVLSEVEYKNLPADQCYRRLEDGSYEQSFYQTPGFENDEEGYEKYCSLIEDQRKSPLLIWEAHTKSAKDQEAWIKVKNVSDAPVNLEDYALSPDTYKGKEAWHLPAQELAPGEMYKIVCKKKKINLKSSRSVALLKKGKFMDGVCCLEAPFGVCVGRVKGKSGFFFLPQEGSSEHFRFISPAPVFVEKPGVYDGKKKMEVKIEACSGKVHYTLNGSVPTKNSPVYTSPIQLDTTTVIRAFCEGDTLRMRSQVATGTYFLNEHHTIPVINVSIPHDVLFNSETGIYELGPGGRGTEYPHFGANYWKKVYKAAHVEYYDSVGSFSLDCGFAIFGGYSRMEAKKSFKLKFDEFYGSNQLDYDIFGEGDSETFKRLVLRSGSQDMVGVMCRDEFFTSLLKEQSPTLLVQRYRPVALYINAKYFGLYYICEKIDKYFAARHLGVSKDSIDIIMSLSYCEEGTVTHYQNLLNYVRSHNLAGNEEYEYMKNLVDIDGLIDQKLGEIYSGNTDVGNVRYIRSSDKNCDQKWRYVYYDIDQSWTTFKPSSFYLRQSGGIAAHNVVIDKMLANAQFRKRFLERLSLHMHKTYSPANATRVFRNLVGEIRPEMERNCKRWPQYSTFQTWEKKCDNFSKKFQTRHKEVLDDLRKELRITPEEDRKYFGDLGI